MIDICLFGREISISSAPSGRAIAFLILLSSVSAGIIIYPAVVVVVVLEDDARGIFIATTVLSFAYVQYKRFVSLSH